MAALKLYAYAPGTGELLGSFQADPDPESGGFLIPWGATDKAPPKVPAGKVAVWVSDAWALWPNHRGETWYDADGRAVVVEQLGDPAAFVPPLSSEAPAPQPAGPVVPSMVYDYQFAGQAYAEKIIDFEAAKAWTGSGAVPKVLLDAVDAVVTHPERHARVVLFLMGTKEFPRNHELTPILAATFGKDTPEKLDAFFVAAGKR